MNEHVDSENIYTHRVREREGNWDGEKEEIMECSVFFSFIHSPSQTMKLINHKHCIVQNNEFNTHQQQQQRKRSPLNHQQHNIMYVYCALAFFWKIV